MASFSYGAIFPGGAEKLIAKCLGVYPVWLRKVRIKWRWELNARIAAISA